MKVAQRPRGRRIVVVDAPCPAPRHSWVLFANRCSRIGSGAERSKLRLGGKSLVQKACARPDLVKKGIDRARLAGVRPALAAARERLDALAPLGYSSAGIVLRLGEDVGGLVPEEGSNASRCFCV